MASRIVDEEHKADLTKSADSPSDAAYVTEMQFIIDFQSKLLELNTIEEIHSFLADKVYELIGEGFTVMATVDEKSKQLKTTKFCGASFFDRIVGILNRNPLETGFRFSDMDRYVEETYRSGKFQNIKTDLHTMLCNKIPKLLCDQAQKLLNIRYIYGLGLVNQETYFGGLTILTSKDISPYAKTIEIIAKQTTITLNRIRAEDARKKQSVFIQTILDNLPIGLAINEIDNMTASYHNKKFGETYGWPNDEIMNVPQFFKNVYPDENYRNEIVKRVMTDFKSGEPERMHWESLQQKAEKNVSSMR